ncbi:MAG TPA: MFS transporter [Mesorhizobium sp.]|nr:MFS transporter [Mesorhizobium sp.]
MHVQAAPRLVWLLMGGVAVVGSNSLALSPILNDVATALDTTPVAVARANAAYGAATALSALTLGRRIDGIGSARVLIAGLVVLALAMLASAAAWHWAALSAAQALAGAAAGVVLPATYSLATSIAPEEKQAQVLGRVLTGWSVSLVAGVPLSALVAGFASWRLSFALLALPLTLSAILLRRLPLPATVAHTERMQVPTAALLRDPRLLALLGACLLFMTGFYGAYTYLGDHARNLLDLSAGQAGLIVLAYGAGFGLASLGDRLIDRWGAERLFPAVLAAVAFIYVLLGLEASGLAWLLGVASAWGFANHFGLNTLVLLLSRLRPESRGAVLGLNSAVTYAGASLGAALFGVIYGGLGFGAVSLAAAGSTAAAAVVALLALRPAGPAMTLDPLPSLQPNDNAKHLS